MWFDFELISKPLLLLALAADGVLYAFLAFL
jgi:hypothetical protein